MATKLPLQTSNNVNVAKAPESSNSALDTYNIVAEVVKPKGRQPAKKKAPAAKKVEEEDDTLDLAQRHAEYNFGSDSSKKIEASKVIALEDDDVVVEVAPTKGGRKPAASKKQPEVVAVGVSPEEKVRKMRSTPFNKKICSMMGRLAITSSNKEEESSESVVRNTSSGEVAAKSRPQRANRRKMTYVLSDFETDSSSDSDFEFDGTEDDEDDEYEFDGTEDDEDDE